VLLNVPEHTNSADLSSTVSCHVTNSCRAVDWMTDSVSSRVSTHHCQQRTTSCSKA